MTAAAHPTRPAASLIVRRILVARGLRGLADGAVSVLLARHLTDLGYSPAQVGVVVTATLLGSAAVTLAFGAAAHRVDLARLLVLAAVLMFGTGLGFAALTTFWPLLLVAAVGTLNPTAGDVSAFLPTEQALVTDEVPVADRPHWFARYNLAGIVGSAVGALLSAVPAEVADRSGWSEVDAQRIAFLAYALVALVVLVLYARTDRDRRAVPAPERDAAQSIDVPVDPRSRRTVWELAALFSLDSAGSGFAVTSIVVLWLHLRFDLDAGETAALFSASAVLAAASQLLAPRLAARIGLVRTMAYTHLPANVALALTAFAPSAGVAVGLLLFRSLLSQMDVPARQSLVMAVVPPADRARAASITNVPRSLASASTPLLAGLLLERSDVGWPLLLAGAIKGTYDIALLLRYRSLPDPHRRPARPS